MRCRRRSCRRLGARAGIRLGMSLRWGVGLVEEWMGVGLVEE